MSFKDMQAPQPQPQYFPVVAVFIALFTICVLIGEAIYIFISSSNWADIRCLPYVMPFASLYGYDVNQNFQFCMAESFKRQAGESIAPLYKFFGGFIGVLSTLIDSTNSIRVGFATFMGGFTTLVSEFGDRFKLFMSQIRLSAQRIRMLMYRVYATFYAMMYMALSSIRAVNNFGGTVLFGFLDTFCFDPDTMVNIQGRGIIPVKDVVVGDIFVGEEVSRVTATFRFEANGQPIVSLPRTDSIIPIIVSTNHYMQYKQRWIRAEDHPLASSIYYWNGGSERPLICFNTSNNKIPIAQYIFRDYDETSNGIDASISWIDNTLNGAMQGKMTSHYKSEWHEMITAFDSKARICKSDGTHVVADEIQLGDKLAPTGDIVTGIIDIESTSYIEMSDGRFSPGTLMWHEPTATWQRIGDIYYDKIIHVDIPIILKSLIVLSGSRIQFASGLIIRDYMEVASPWAEDAYSTALRQLD
jgi:hypothetical protein